MNRSHTNLEPHYLVRFKDGDPAAFTYFFYTYWEELYTVAYRHLRDTDQSKDIVQEVYIHIWEKRHLLKDDYTTLRPYLHKAVKNKVLNYYATERVRKEVLDNMFARMDVLQLLDTGSLAHYQALEVVVDKAVARLPKLMQAVYLMRSDNHSIQQIAKDLNLAEQTVKNYLSDAKKILKKELTQRFNEQDTMTVMFITTVTLHHFLT
ncbi:RNA polymerase sigma factor [Sphingobacterium psychroaquaticum]|uniref:RNA polymerase sigma-70 factor, ECF subfamily n=1 Tax=Sphingobacterium psychroaquaticum TaxID=561061 RepID=A0A1X7IBG5_9SPHI|nr:sigma-70 family RNA polymerase sigma factor [Sphingobacterium psychroaquaticum]SMG11963.1 RNA polymerase sigma-70 factor, ECF subfamily [Sphingobacterium psychroaquaticum]